MPALPSLPVSFRSRRTLVWAALAGAVVVALLLWSLQAGLHADLPDAAWLQQRQAEVRALHAAGPWAFAAGLFALFTLLAALALPGCSVLALTAGMVLGWLPGTLLVVLASTVGATLSFLAARHLWRDAVQRRWGHRLHRLHAGVARDGGFYLFSLRVAPVIPFALVNPLMGLSTMSTRQFFGVSLLGMLGGSAAYVYAGTALAQARGWQDLTSPSMGTALLLLAALPWGLRWAYSRARPGWRQRA